MALFDFLRRSTHTLQTTFGSIMSSEATQFHVTQFVEGFKTVINFPFTMLKMPFSTHPRRLAGHIVRYNFLYYALPVLGYYGYARQLLENTLAGTGGNHILAADLLMNAVFLRAAANAYLTNVFNNINASSIHLEDTAASTLHHPETEHCSCKESLHLRGKLMSPLYYIGKILTPEVLGSTPMVGFLVKLILKPLAYGECLAEVKLDQLCNNHRNDFFSKHTTATLGMGVAAVLSTQFASVLAYYLTGVSSPWLKDALFNLLFPFILFHVHNTALSQEIKAGKDFDVFFATREMINATIKRLSEIIIPLLNTPQQENTLLEKLKTMLYSNPGILERIVLNNKLFHHPESLVEFGPLNLLLEVNQQDIIDSLNKVDMVTDNPNLVKGALSIYASLPFVPPKEVTRFIVDLLTKDPGITKKVTAEVRRLLQHAQQFDPAKDFDERRKVFSSSLLNKNGTLDTQIHEDYAAATPSPPASDDDDSTSFFRIPSTHDVPAREEDHEKEIKEIINDFYTVFLPSLQPDSSQAGSENIANSGSTLSPASKRKLA